MSSRAHAPARAPSRPAAHPDRASRARSSTAGAIPPSARVGDARRRRAPTSSATATTSCAPSCATAARATTRLARGADAPHRRATSTATAGQGAFPVDALGPLDAGRSRPGPTRFASWRDELERKVAAGQDDLSGELSEGVAAARSDAAERAEGDDRRRIERALEPSARPTRPTSARATPRSTPSCATPSSATPTAPARDDRTRPLERRRRPRARPASAPGMSCSRARGAASSGVARAAPRASPSSASTSSTCRRSTRSASRTARAPTTRSTPAPATPAARGRSATRAAATTRSTRTSARSTTSTRSSPTAARARHRDRARLRDPVLGRPPVADRAPGVVQPPPRRHAEVRREPAQEVPGHLQRQLATPRTGSGLWQALLDVVAATGSTHGVQRLPRRQPAHQAARRSGSG